MKAGHGYVGSNIEFSVWIASTPTVDEARPAHCPKCDRASRSVSAGLLLWGHGIRARQIRGPVSPDAKADIREVTLRRYVCRNCGAVILVGPKVIRPRHLFLLSSIALALALWSVEKLSASEVRRRVNPYTIVGPTVFGWLMLRRWAAAIRERRLFTCVPACPPDWPLRRVAQRATETLASLGPSGVSSQSVLSRVCAGAALAC